MRLLLCLLGWHTNKWYISENNKKNWVCLNCGEINETSPDTSGENADQCKEEERTERNRST